MKAHHSHFHQPLASLAHKDPHSRQKQRLHCKLGHLGVRYLEVAGSWQDCIPLHLAEEHIRLVERIHQGQRTQVEVRIDWEQCPVEEGSLVAVDNSLVDLHRGPLVQAELHRMVLDRRNPRKGHVLDSLRHLIYVSY